MSPSAQTPPPSESARQAQSAASPEAGSSAPQPDDVDALLASSLKARHEDDFTWREPDRSPRWWERAEMRRAAESASSDLATASPAAARTRPGVRVGALVWALICMGLAGWVILTVGFGLNLDPLAVLLVACATAGILLVLSGLLPRSGRRRNRDRRRRRVR